MSVWRFFIRSGPIRTLAGSRDATQFRPSHPCWTLRDPSRCLSTSRQASPTTPWTTRANGGENPAATLQQPSDAHTIVDDIKPVGGEVVIQKTKPSAFFGTPLVASLIDKGVDTLIVLGCTTSGCVRATALDAFSFGFVTVVVEDGVFDRGWMSHAVNLFDLSQKYADVLDSGEVGNYLLGLSDPVQDPTPRIGHLS